MSDMKIQKYLMDAGLGSRRQVEQEFIALGRVTVNDEIAELGRRIDPEKDTIKVDDQRVSPRKKVYFVMNKPPGYICSRQDEKGRRRVYDLLPKNMPFVHTVGRLDFHSEGLLIFTNDGELTRRLTQRKFHVEREYEVKLKGRTPPKILALVRRGVKLEDGFVKVRSLRVIRSTEVNLWVRVVVDEGRNRLVRRLFDRFGVLVIKLKRVRYGTLGLGRLERGAIRRLTPDEIKALKTLVGLSETA